jgi:glycosyltransferase involved in cell wall biosynthesis
MKPLRVLHVLASLDRGGAEAMIMSVYRKIDREKVQFDFVVNESEKEYEHEKEIRQLGGNIYYVPRYTITNHISYKRAWENLLIGHPEWYLIHGHHTSPAFIYLKIAKKHNRVTIAHSHIAGSELSVKSYFKVLMRYPLRYISDHLFACSDSAAKWMFGNRKSVKIINNAINTKKFSFNYTKRVEKRTEMGLKDYFVIGHVGRFQTQKNHEFLIDLFKVIHEKCDKSVLLLVGDGELRQSIEKKVRALGLTDYVIFTGVRSDIDDLLQIMDVFVFPSLYEGLGIVAVEAQAAGLRCVVADTVPKEAYVTDLIETVPLKAKMDIWAEHILKYTVGYERVNTSNLIKSKGFDIDETSIWLEDFYIENGEGIDEVGIYNR